MEKKNRIVIYIISFFTDSDSAFFENLFKKNIVPEKHKKWDN